MLKSLHLVSGITIKNEKHIDFDLSFTPEASSEMIIALRELRQGFSVFDPEYPSPSDPGAYLDFFFRDDPDNRWRMTLGNHGWSGGAYIIPEVIVSAYLYAISRRPGFSGIDLGNSGFRHYPDEDELKNLEMIKRLKQIHHF